MNIEKAKKIITNYRVYLGQKSETGLRQSSSLQNSKANIRYAYFVLIEDEINKKRKLDPKEKERIIEEYLELNNFIDDIQFSKYTKIYQDWQTKKLDPYRNKKDDKLIKQYVYFLQTLKSLNPQDEIIAFIEEIEKVRRPNLGK